MHTGSQRRKPRKHVKKRRFEVFSYINAYRKELRAKTKIIVKIKVQSVEIAPIGACLSVFRGSWGSWARLGADWGENERVLEATWATVGASWGPSWKGSWLFPGRLGGHLADFKVVLASKNGPEIH